MYLVYFLTFVPTFLDVPLTTPLYIIKIGVPGGLRGFIPSLGITVVRQFHFYSYYSWCFPSPRTFGFESTKFRTKVKSQWTQLKRRFAMANIFSFLFSNIVFTFINRKVKLSEFSRHFLNFQLHCSGMGHRTYPGDVLFGSFENKDVCSRPYLLRVLQAELRGCFFTTPCTSSCTSCPFCLLSYYRQTGNKVNLQYKNLFL